MTIAIIIIVIIIHIVIIKTRAAKEDVNIMDCTHLAPLTVELLALVAWMTRNNINLQQQISRVICVVWAVRGG